MRMSHNYNYLDLADFDNTNITLVFEPDEDVDQPVNEKSARIFVTDDAINEAMEQVFIAELMLVSSLDSSSVQITRPSTLCRIVDNDRKCESRVLPVLYNL